MVYVGDLLMAGNNESYITSIKKELKKGFEMTDLGYVHYYMGIEVTQHPKFILLPKKKYIGDLLNNFGMDEWNPLTTPMEKNLKRTLQGKDPLTEVIKKVFSVIELAKIVKKKFATTFIYGYRGFGVAFNGNST